MKIALCQMDVVAGDPDKNWSTMYDLIEEAKHEGAKIVVFPEMCVGGYLLGDRWLVDDYCKWLESYNDKLAPLSKDIVLIYGNVFVEKLTHFTNKDGRSRKYNAAYVFEDGKLLRAVSKTLLPNYRFFDDERYFFSTKDTALDFKLSIESNVLPVPVTIDGKEIKLGVEICEDLWVKDYRYDNKPLNVTKMLIEKGAELIINISASPWTYGKHNARHNAVQFLKKDCGEKFVPFLYVNNVGAQNNGKNIITFDGGTTVYNSNAEPVLITGNDAYKQKTYYVESDLIDKLIPAVEVVKNRSNWNPAIPQKFAAIVRGLQHIKDMMGVAHHPQWVIGLSGGIDSAVVACILVHAFGKESVMAINMPTQYNSQKTKDAANQIAKKLGIDYRIVPIQKLANDVESALVCGDMRGTTPMTDFHFENLQAKIRGTSILSNIAAKEGRLFTNNGNKVEVALGYATLYGDVGGAIAPIGDLTKDEVYQMGHYINWILPGHPIPEELFPYRLFHFGERIAPSAELKNDQVDPMKFGYHCALVNAFTDYRRKSPEDIVRWWLERKLAENLSMEHGLIERYGIRVAEYFIKDLEWFCKQWNRAVFKRIQSPPIIVTSKGAFGYDERESMLPLHFSSEYKNLKEQALKKNIYE